MVQCHKDFGAWDFEFSNASQNCPVPLCLPLAECCDCVRTQLMQITHLMIADELAEDSPLQACAFLVRQCYLAPLQNISPCRFTDFSLPMLAAAIFAP